MSLEDVRKSIDRIDSQLKGLLMERLDCSMQVVRAKQQAGSTQIFRADREAQILEQLGEGVPQDRLAPYTSVVRKVIATSRMYQYSILLQDDPQLFSQVAGSKLCELPSTSVTVETVLPSKPGALAAVLAVVGDYGVGLEQVVQEGSSFQLVLKADVTQAPVRTLLFQLSQECAAFTVTDCR